MFELDEIIDDCIYSMYNKTKCINSDRKLFLRLINWTTIIIERNWKIEYSRSYDRQTALSNFRIMSIHY